MFASRNMAYKIELTYPHITDVAWFHAYVACSVIGLRWGKHTPTSANQNSELNKILREYLTFACGDDEWAKRAILDAMRGKTGTSLKRIAKKNWRSLFPRNRKARPLAVPTELSERGEEPKFDLARIEQWRDRVRTIKKEISMNEEATAAAEAASQEVDVTSRPPIDRRPPTDKSNSSRVTVNFFLPPGVNPDDLTLENYREVTGKRFRMTKDQAQVRGLSREDAFAESKALAVSQLGVK